MQTIKKIFPFITFLLFSLSLTAQGDVFTNPLLPSGPDPWCIFKDGYYYYTNTTAKNITIWKTDDISNLHNAEKKIVFTPPEIGPYSKNLWAPEIHFLEDKWYIYFAADSGYNSSHRLWVLENSSADPMEGEWILKGKIKTPGDKWSIDGSVFKYKKRRYFIWSGWEGDTNGQQNIYIARMKNPFTLKKKRSMISSPQLDWEIHGDLNNEDDVPHVSVNEGPQSLMNNKKLFIIYSASGCWTDYYALGILTAKRGRNLMRPATWQKSPEPVFKKSIENKVYAPGHNSFFKSPDGREDWILYHANDNPGEGCEDLRSPRAQPFTWNLDGTPNFGKPVSIETKLIVPSNRVEKINQ